MRSIERVEDLPRDRPIFIYGAGRAGRLFRQTLEAAGGFDLRSYVQTSGPAGPDTLSLEELARDHPYPKTVAVASQWVYEIATLLRIAGVPDDEVLGVWHLCMRGINREDKDTTFDYYFRTYGGFDLMPPRRARYVLLADSFGYHLGWGQFFDPVVFGDRSVPGISVCDIGKLLPYCESMEPEMIFLFVGWVDLTERTQDIFPYLIDETLAACRTIRGRGIRPVVLSQIPMAPGIAGAHRGSHSVDYFNRCVAHFNRKVAAGAPENGGSFIDVAALLCDDGGLRADFAAKDGAHLNRPAARVIVDAVRAFIDGAPA